MKVCHGAVFHSIPVFQSPGIPGKMHGMPGQCQFFNIRTFFDSSSFSLVERDQCTTGESRSKVKVTGEMASARPLAPVLRSRRPKYRQPKKRLERYVQTEFTIQIQ
jgi:hypothetical protein